MKGNAVIAIIIGGLTVMGLILWALSYWWLNAYRKWAEYLKAEQDRPQTIQRANSELRARTSGPPRIPTTPPPA